MPKKHFAISVELFQTIGQSRSCDVCDDADCHVLDLICEGYDSSITDLGSDTDSAILLFYPCRYIIRPYHTCQCEIVCTVLSSLIMSSELHTFIDSASCEGLQRFHS